MHRLTIPLTIIFSACAPEGNTLPASPTVEDSAAVPEMDTASDSDSEVAEPEVGEETDIEVLEVHEVVTTEEGAAPPPVGRCSGSAPSTVTYRGRLTNTGTGTTGADCYYKVTFSGASDGDQCLLRFSIAYTPAGYSTTNASAALADAYYRGDGGLMYYTSGSYSYLRLGYQWCYPLGAEDGLKL
jgi:hypothetical protein